MEPIIDSFNACRLMIVLVSDPQTLSWLTACITEADILRQFYLFWREINNLANWWVGMERKGLKREGERVTLTLGSWGAGDYEVKLLPESEVCVGGQHVSMLSKEMTGNTGLIGLVLQRLQVPEGQVIPLTSTGRYIEPIAHFSPPEILHNLIWINSFAAQSSLCKWREDSIEWNPGMPWLLG